MAERLNTLILKRSRKELRDVEIKKSSELSTPKVTALIYAQPGIGKTTAIGEIAKTSGKKVLVLDIDRSSYVLKDAENVDVAQIGLDMAKFVEAVEWLENGGGEEYDIIALDNLSELESQMLIEYGKVGKNKPAPELQHYGKVQYKIIDYIRRLRQLPQDIILTTWETMQDVVQVDGSKYTRSVPKLAGQNTDIVSGLCNMVGKLEISEKDGSRYIRLDTSNTRYGKDQVYKRTYCKASDLLTPNQDEEKGGE